MINPSQALIRVFESKNKLSKNTIYSRFWLVRITTVAFDYSPVLIKNTTVKAVKILTNVISLVVIINKQNQL